MTLPELHKASRSSVLRLARWLGVRVDWDTTYEGIVEAVGWATTVRTEVRR